MCIRDSVTPVAPRAPTVQDDDAAGTSAQAADTLLPDEETLDFLQSGVRTQEPQGAGVKKLAQPRTAWADAASSVGAPDDMM
eukprot:13791701-Heterocapsa_arctica.AAC.1